MKTRLATIFVLILIIGATITGGLLWNRLPDQMASHWNVNDQVDDYLPKIWGVFLMPLVTLGLFLIFLLVPKIDPLKANIAQFRETFNLFVVFMVGFMVYIYSLTLRWNLGSTNIAIGKAMLPALGLLFIVIGSLLRKAKRNFFIGIRTPWTLSSDLVWEKTHQLGATLFMISGVLAVIGGLIGGNVALWMLIIPLIGSTLFLLVYSYVLYQKEVEA